MRRLAVAVVALIAVAGCVTPSIPIPPPDPGKMTFHVAGGSGSGALGTATFSYPADPAYKGAVVYVFDQDLGEGVIEAAGTDGAFPETQPFPAVLGNQVLVTIQREDQSEATCIVLQDGMQSSTNVCE